MKTWSLPSNYEGRIELVLNSLGFSLKKARPLAKQVQILSDFYIHHRGSPTPWEKEGTLVAHLVYYFPLNFVRSQALLAEMNRLKFLLPELEIIDFGAGLSPLTAVLENRLKTYCVEVNNNCQKIFKILNPQIQTTWVTEISQVPKIHPQALCFSYSLPEIKNLPEWFKSYDSLILLEPSDRISGRRLLELRQILLNAGYFIWAPCTHQQLCPLLRESHTDWCHTREIWDPPQWFLEIEKYLPIKNKTLTFSYLLASRRPPPQFLNQFARLTGDLLKQKGKSRQMICRGPQREFLTWLNRDQWIPHWKRGDLVQIIDEPNRIANELRPKPGQVVDTKLD